MGISQQALGSAPGIRHQSVNKYENQKIEPDIATLFAMADFFGATVDFLIGRESEENKREENDILSRYKALSPKKRACADLVIRTLYEEK